MLSPTEENYLKSLFRLTLEDGQAEAGTNELATFLGVKPASANDMLKKLKEKDLVDYEKYGKIALTSEGKARAVEVIRKHRLWETFLYDKLSFTWDEVHEVAEQLEHIQSSKLIDKLDEFLKFPAYDPHGDAIPNSKGIIPTTHKKTLDQEVIGHHCTMVAVRDNSAPFLQYVTQLGLSLHNNIKVLDRHAYDGLMEIEVNGKTCSISPRFAQNIVIVCNDCSRKKQPASK